VKRELSDACAMLARDQTPTSISCLRRTRDGDEQYIGSCEGRPGLSGVHKFRSKTASNLHKTWGLDALRDHCDQELSGRQNAGGVALSPQVMFGGKRKNHRKVQVE
jgi:hypothetical protein